MTSLTGAPAPQAPGWSPERRWDPVEGGAGALAKRIDALAAFVRAAEPYLPPHRLEAARELADRATERLSLPLTLTVVALAGATGGGKSSLFNALAGADLSPVGVRRPTTGDVYAAVFGRPEAASDLLDWLRVQPARRFARDSVLDDRDGLSGLVLLDLPDFDSVERAHAAEVERLLRMVDVVVWVVDPQKYADHVLHERHLSRRGPYRDVTLVVLNQADLLRAADLERLLGHLRDLLVADGLDPSTAVATSAISGAAGTAPLREWLTRVVASRRAPLQRLAADLSEVVADVSDLVGPPPATAQLDTVVAGELASGMAQVAAAPAVIDALEHGYRTRAAHAMSPPVLRWIRGSRRDEAPALADDAPPEPEAEAAGTDGVAPGPAARAAADLVVRRVAARAADGLPAPWPEVAAAAALTDLDELVERVGRAVGRVRPDLDRQPGWWRVFAVGQWLAVAAVLAGAVWYATGWIMGMLDLPTAYPAVGPLPAPAALAVGGLAAMVVLAVVGTQLARWHARRLGAQAAARLRAAINDLGRAHVLAPLRAVLRAYGYARDALAEAAGR
ncbi:MAG TPA: GTPase [Natronosporangium sp.]|jgi:energy-coupling factor transporter ATP-binding protein EcfA2